VFLLLLWLIEKSFDSRVLKLSPEVLQGQNTEIIGEKSGFFRLPQA
jgi:hypothetical protein